MLPCDYYLRYLITTCQSTEAILDILSNLGFAAKAEDVDSMRDSLMLPPAFTHFAQGQQVDERFLLKYAARFHIKEMWQHRLRSKPKAIKETLELVEEKHLRLIPLILALKQYKGYDTALQELGKEYSKESVHYLLHYFFNVERMNMTGWRKFFQRAAPEARDLLDQPLSYVLFYFGLTPQLSYPDILRDLMHMGFYKAKDYMGIDTRDHIAMGKSMAELAIKAGEKLQKYGKGETKTFLEDIHLGFEKADLPIPSIEEIDEEEEDTLTLI